MLKLARLAATLDDVSHGDGTIRVPVDPGSGQIDRIARRINEHLDRLAALNETMRNSAVALAHDLRTQLSRAYLTMQLAAAEGEGPRRSPPR